MKQLLLLGTDHHLLQPSKLGGLRRTEQLLEDLAVDRQRGACAGFVVVRTCNRLELYLDLGAPADARRCDARRLFGDAPFYEHRGREAAEHLIRVAASLESMVLGENQIHGQVRTAWETSQHAGVCSPRLNTVFRGALRGAREIRQQTGLSERSVSVASLAVQSLMRTAPHSVAVLGAGTMASKAAVALAKREGIELRFVNRTLARARNLAERHGGSASSLADFLADPPPVDVLLVAARGEQPLVDEALVGSIQARRPRAGTLTIVDVCVPAGTHSRLAGRADLDLIDMDTLRSIASQNAEARREASRRAVPIIEERLARIERKLRRPSLDPQRIRLAHVSLADERARELLRKQFRHLAEADHERLRQTLVDIAKAHAHLHLEDLKRRVPAPSPVLP